MNKMPAGEMVVIDLAGSQALVFCQNPTGVRLLTDMGFHVTGEYFAKPISTDADRGDETLELARNLIRAGALFSYGHGWSPSALLDLYRERGDITENYRVIAWTSPDEFFIQSAAFSRD